MPKKPCAHYGCNQFVEHGKRYCKKHKSITLKAERSKLPEYRKWYSYKSWRTARISYLMQNPLCVTCQAKGVLNPAKVIDHIKPHKGNLDLFWDVDNWQSLCKQCHDRKTWNETLGKTENIKGTEYYPEWLAEVKTNLYIVCGAPCAGKTTYVNQHKKDNSIVIDIDDIIYELSGERYPDNRNDYFDEAIKIRNEILLSLTWDNDYDEAWFIVTASRQSDRDWWKDKLGAKEVIIITTSKELCIERILESPDRNSNRFNFISAVNNWWKNYSVG